jgi:hypothetical protein
LRTRKRKDGDGSRPRAAERFQVCPRETRGGVEPDAVAEQHRQYIHQDLVDEPPPQALAGHVSTEDFEVPLARSVQCRGDRFPDVTGEERDRQVYGPEYSAPENIDRLKERSLSHKRSLALREFALGVEALERFVRGEPLLRIHECVFGVLALESEPVDPRL